MTVYDFIEKCVIGKYRVVERVHETSDERVMITDILNYDDDIPETLHDYKLIFILPCIEKLCDSSYDAVTKIICEKVVKA